MRSGLNLRPIRKTDIELIDSMGTDKRIAEAARVSHIGFDIKDQNKDDAKLIEYLYTNKHTSPFEHVRFTFRVELPLFVARQWMRHRTGSFNEISARYTQLAPDFWVPDNLREQGSSTNKQVGGRDFINNWGISDLVNGYTMAYWAYEKMISKGIAREQARAVLPVGIFTKFYWTVDLHNLFHFLRLRLSEHAQPEIRLYAEAIIDLIRPIVPLALEVFENETIQV